MPTHHHDPNYERPIQARYLDPVELVWLATARRLGLHVRRDQAIFSMTDGEGLLALGPRDSLDADDCLAQMVFHEICHWITNGLETFHERDWAFPLWDDVDPREHACLRLQAELSGRYGLRTWMGPTGGFRQYYDRIPADTLAPIDDSPWEADVVQIAASAIARSAGAPWVGPVSEALAATAAIQGVLRPFLTDYATEIDDDALPSLWSR